VWSRVSVEAGGVPGVDPVVEACFGVGWVDVLSTVFGCFDVAGVALGVGSSVECLAVLFAVGAPSDGVGVIGVLF
jgi:hypothetical protein